MTTKADNLANRPIFIPMGPKTSIVIPGSDHISFLLTIFFILLIPCVTNAAVVEVTFFPDSAMILETTKAHFLCSDSDKCKANLILSPQADPESLVVSLPPGSRLKIDDLQVKQIQRQDDARIAELRKQIAKLKDERKELQARLLGLEVQIQFWQLQTKAKTKNITDADHLAAAIGRNVKKAAQEKFFIENELEKNDKRTRDLQDSLNQAAGKKETAWEATLTFAGSGQNGSFLTYSYNLRGCGWLPLYRIEALPAENMISFSWEAQLWQSSGEDWKQVQVNLATLQPLITTAPPNLPPWIIKPRSAVIYKSARQEKAAGAPLMKGSLKDESNQEFAVEESSRTTYSIWSIGRKNIAAGVRQRLKVKDEIWPADFLFLARPSLSPQTFVRAQVKFDKSMDIPAGQATYLVDGAILGKRNFALAGTEGTLFFGTSPFISVTTATLADKSGAKTIFQNKQTRLWLWLIEAKNSGNVDVKLRIEEPCPQARDERIHLTFKPSPEPAEKDHEKFVWLIDLAAQQKKIIQNTIELEAPKDMDLDMGWRR
jgi:uncharacterized protein (TIGR02231 family)